MEGNSADRHWQTKVLDTWKVPHLTDIGRPKVLDTWKVPQLTDTGRPKYLIHGRQLSRIFLIRKVLVTGMTRPGKIPTRRTKIEPSSNSLEADAVTPGQRLQSAIERIQRGAGRGNDRQH